MLVDTAVWVDHLRRRDPILTGLLEHVQVIVHPFVVGEVACGHLTRRAEILAALESLPKAPVVEHSVVLTFIERHGLMGRGLGWVDMHLLASAWASTSTRPARACSWTSGYCASCHRRST